ncbi:polyprenyl synthetase family protein [Telmatospirillum siberiense]|uniref:Geranylgeranyl pyrophosphate synthase n=1 Tax=Telmatospirillum siberiense TaxID=382514 RepID=A0A2N3PTJ7_9PROT|nr:polyprenyl synthetase family protein [Telmatospirillum siberiense]PKU23716.1 geranylgeranyl pyrophosphate synthase [Telmatospirillum siberiense]
MEAGERIENALQRAVQRTTDETAPPKLAAAIHHAVFPGGARVRPRLTLAVASACGEADGDLVDGTATAIELLHCASLVHDDLPCFDDASIRRGQASVHAAFGTPIALLAGDALIVLAFDTLARSSGRSPHLLAPLITAIAQGAGAPTGIAAGQAWESEPNPPSVRYRLAKTGALFVAATMSGALASGADPTAWRSLGLRLGEAYQVADDLLDAVSAAADCDKPVGRDAILGRPNTVAELGVSGAMAHLEKLIDAAMDAIPPCQGEKELRDLVRLQALRLAPKHPAHQAA